jgi:hypothetical protein
MRKKIISILKKNQDITFEAKGNSMFPLLISKDKVLLRKRLFGKLKANDIILFSKRGLQIHRIIYRKKKYLITKGDNNLKSDGKILRKNYISVVKSINRGGIIISPKLYLINYSVVYYQQLIKIFREFNKRNVNYVVLKGLPLQLYYHQSEPQYLYTDCDILIAREDYNKVNDILTKLNFSPESRSFFSIDLFKRHATQITYFKIVKKITVRIDLHLSLGFLLSQTDRIEPLYSSKKIRDITNDFLRNKTSVKYQNINYYILPKVQLVIYLSLHIFHHNYLNIRRYELLDSIIKKEFFSYQEYRKIRRYLNNYKLTNFVFPTFSILVKYFPNKKSYRIIQSLKNHITRKLDVTNIEVFNEEKRLKAGINRFLLIYKLSPVNRLLKPLIIFNPILIILAISIVIKKLNIQIRKI